MKPARIIILGVAIGTAALAGMIAMQLAGGKPPEPQAVTQVVQQAPTVQVLVASSNLSIGMRLSTSSLKWAKWPEENVQPGFITERQRPNAINDLQNSVVRLPMMEGEPIRQEKVADSTGKVLSALLPAGKRAVSTEITVATGAGGFILPNDRVDVIMVRRGDDGQFETQTVLTNIRVLAIDQLIEEKSGSQSVTGTTATLELTPDQAKVIAVSQQMAQRLTLALRSVADATDPDTNAPDYLLNGGSETSGIQVIKSGSIVKANSTSSTTMSK